MFIYIENIYKGERGRKEGKPRWRNDETINMTPKENEDER